MGSMSCCKLRPGIVYELPCKFDESVFQIPSSTTSDSLLIPERLTGSYDVLTSSSQIGKKQNRMVETTKGTMDIEECGAIMKGVVKIMGESYRFVFLKEAMSCFEQSNVLLLREENVEEGRGSECIGFLRLFVKRVAIGRPVYRGEDVTPKTNSSTLNNYVQIKNKEMLAHYDDVSDSWICTHLYLPSDIALLIRHFQYPPPAIFFETDDLYLCIYGSDRDVQHIVTRGKLFNS